MPNVFVYYLQYCNFSCKFMTKSADSSNGDFSNVRSGLGSSQVKSKKREKVVDVELFFPLVFLLKKSAKATCIFFQQKYL